MKGRSQGSLSTSLIRSLQQSSRIFFMTRLRADLTVFHALCSAASPFECVSFLRVFKYSQRRIDNLFQLYIELLLRLCPQRGIELSHAATTFGLVTRTTSSNDQADFTQTSSSMSLVSSRYSQSLSSLSRLVFQQGLLPLSLLPVFIG